MRLRAFKWNVHFLCNPECPRWAYPYLECGYKDRQRHWWRWTGSHVPGVHSVKGGSCLQQGPCSSWLQQMDWVMSHKDCLILTFLPCSHSRNLCCLNMAFEDWLSLWHRRWGCQSVFTKSATCLHNLLPCMSPILNSIYENVTNKSSCIFLLVITNTWLVCLYGMTLLLKNEKWNLAYFPVCLFFLSLSACLAFAAFIMTGFQEASQLWVGPKVSCK